MNRIDMAAGVGTQVVAAASGIIRAIVDVHGDFPSAGNGVDAAGNVQNDALEGDVGRAGGPHLQGGFIQGVNVVPSVCDIPGNLDATGAVYVAADCVAIPAPAPCSVVPAPGPGAIFAVAGVVTIGTAGADVINGTEGPENGLLYGWFGNDRLAGGAGADTCDPGAEPADLVAGCE